MTSKILLVTLCAAALASAQDGPRQVVIEVDGKATTPFRARVAEGMAWLPVTAFDEAMGLEVKRMAAGGPALVCQGPLCYVGAAELLTEDDLEAQLDGVLALIGARVTLKVDAPDQPMRYVVASAQPETEEPALSLVKLGEAFPDLTFETLDGKTLRPSAFRGRKLLLVNWASW